MAIIGKGVGAPKLSEICIDDGSLANTVLAAPESTDGLTVIDNAAKTIGDALVREGVVLTSTGTMNWTSGSPGVLNLNSNNLVIYLTAGITGTAPVTLTLHASAAATINIASGNILYAELLRTNTASNQTLDYNTTSGKTVRVASGVPALSATPGGYTPTICIPICMNIGGNLYWANGNVWITNTTSIIGGGSPVSIAPGSITGGAGGDLAANTVTASNMAANGGVYSGNINATYALFVQVTSISITTYGRPIFVSLQSTGNTTSFIGGGIDSDIAIIIDGDYNNTITRWQGIDVVANIAGISGACPMAAGNHTVNLYAGGGGGITLANVRLFAIEL